MAARISVEIGADLAILMSDVDGIYDRPPSTEGARILHSFVPDDLGKITFGTKSDVGTGGMESKVKSAKGKSRLPVHSFTTALTIVTFNPVANLLEPLRSFLTTLES